MFNLGARAAQDDESALHALGDFTANARLLLLSLVATPIGIISAYVAVGLLALIAFFTNLVFLHLTSAERKTLLVAGAAAGMSATFAAPLASVLLAVELLLFEWKPRSFVPVAMASATAAAARRYLLGLGPLFPVPAHPLFIGPCGLL